MNSKPRARAIKAKDLKPGMLIWLEGRWREITRVANSTRSINTSISVCGFQFWRARETYVFVFTNNIGDHK